MHDLNALQDADRCPHLQLGTHLIVHGGVESYETHLIDMGTSCRKGCDRRCDGILVRPAEYPGAYERAGNDTRSDFVRDLKRTAVAASNSERSR